VETFEVARFTVGGFQALKRKRETFRQQATKREAKSSLFADSDGVASVEAICPSALGSDSIFFCLKRHKPFERSFPTRFER
jgi:hypothetical protein